MSKKPPAPKPKRVTVKGNPGTPYKRSKSFEESAKEFARKQAAELKPPKPEPTPFPVEQGLKVRKPKVRNGGPAIVTRFRKPPTDA